MYVWWNGGGGGVCGVLVAMAVSVVVWSGVGDIGVVVMMTMYVV